MKVLIAGGAGFLGYEAAKHFAKKGHKVILLDPAANQNQILSENVEIISDSIKNIENFGNSIGKTDLIIHSAWDFTEDVKRSINENLLGTLSLAEFALSSGSRRFVFYSSSVIYGKPVSIPIAEEHPLNVEESRAPLHALLKLYTEKLLLHYHAYKHLPLTIFRIWWSFNDERAPGKTYREILAKIKKGERVEVPAGAGGSIVYAPDLSLAAEKALETEEANGKIFNAVSFFFEWSEVLRKIAERVGSRSEIVETRGEWNGPGFLEGRWQLDDSRMRRILNINVDANEREKKFIEVSLKMLEKLP
ncbi:MAG: NAD(P)-dependent oxidoreductase [Fervidicoccaceae archaeon]